MGLPTSLWENKTPDNAPLVRFMWRDIRRTDHWSDTDEAIRPARKLATAGWILYDGVDPGDPGNEIVVLGNHYDYEEERWADFHCFPKQVVRLDAGL